MNSLQLIFLANKIYTVIWHNDHTCDHCTMYMYILHSPQMPQLYKLINDDNKIEKYYYYEILLRDYILYMTNQHNVVYVIDILAALILIVRDYI